MAKSAAEKAARKARYASDPAFREREDARVKAHNRKKYKSSAEFRAKNAARCFEFSLRSKYGLSRQEYEALRQEQGHACDICRTPFSDLPPRQVHVDHCHSTGKVRGILCGRCNPMLGNAKDNPATLRTAAEYLERHK